MANNSRQLVVKNIKNDKSVNNENTISAYNAAELSFAMEEVELVIAYLCRTSGKINKKLIESSLQARRQYLAQGFLSVSSEATFWFNYHQLMSAIKPITLASIQQTNPSVLWQKKNPLIGRRVRRILFYYGFGVCIVILSTITLQTYYMIGVDVLQKTHELFTERNKYKTEISKLTSQENNKSQELIELQKNYQKLDQEFDANRILLFDWNSFWQLDKKVQPEFSKYDDYNYQHALDMVNTAFVSSATNLQSTEQAKATRAEESKSNYRRALHEIEQQRHLSESRNLFFRARLSAVHVVNLLESYLLPLLFGCLGAFTLVLRSIHSSFQDGTFTLKMCLDFNLRILLGGVTGISSGMFLGDNLAVPEGKFSPMLIAFLIGYNVEILFAIMDDFAQRLVIDSGSRKKK